MRIQIKVNNENSNTFLWSVISFRVEKESPQLSNLGENLIKNLRENFLTCQFCKLGNFNKKKFENLS